jgi:exodeoxyribonuclease VII small subunit
MAEKYETTLKQLDQVVAKLEAGGLELEQSLKLFEKGVKLAAECTKMLDDAQTRMDVLFEEAGELKIKPVPEEEEEA